MNQLIPEDGSKRFAEGAFKGVLIVTHFMQTVESTRLSALLEPTEKDTAIRGVFLRTLAWMRTLRKLDQPVDFQAVLTSNRGLLEAAVDLILLRQGASPTSASMMLAWEQSAKLHAGEQLRNYYGGQDAAVPPEFDEIVAFVNRDGASILSDRHRFWPQLKGKHPRRWTGSSGLLDDVVRADNASSTDIKNEMGTSLTEYYHANYARLNWYVHGSTLVGVRTLSPDGFHALCGLAFKDCTDLAVLSTKTVLDNYDYFEYDTEVKAGWDRLWQQRLAAFASAHGWSSDETDEEV